MNKFQSEWVMRFLWISLGILIGFVLGLSNLYIALKVGLTIGAAILAALAWATIRMASKDMGNGIHNHDQVCYISLASAMSYGCGTVTATSLAALLMHDPKPGSPLVLMVWVAAVSGLGSCLAMPLRRQMLANHPFPTGRVLAATLTSLKTKTDLTPFFTALTGAWLFLAIKPGFSGLLTHISTKGLLPSPSPMLVGLGALLGVPVCLSMFMGGVLFHHVLPFTDSGHNATTWLALGMIIAGGLLDMLSSIGKRAKTHALSFRDPDIPALPMLTILCLGTVGATSVLGLGAPLLGLAPVLLLLGVFVIIAGRVTGETDVTPVGALGKLALLIFGMFPNSGAGPNLIAAGSLTGASAAGADFLTDLRFGKELGCPRARQFKYQFSGAVLGPLLLTPVFLYLLEGKIQLGSEALPAPAAVIWLQVAEFTTTTPSGRPLGYLAGGLVIGALTFCLQQRYATAPLPRMIPLATAAFLDFPTVFTLLLGALLGRALKGKGMVVWCGLIAADSSANMIYLLVAN